MPRLVNAVPKYRKHRASGQAIVTLYGRDHYLGPHGSKASKLEYDRLIAEWLANGREVPPTEAGPLTVSEVLTRYWKFAERHYRKNGKQTGTIENIRYALKPLRLLYGKTPAEEFGPQRLKVVRAKMLESGLSRGVINSRVGIVKRVFKWAVAEELVPPSVFQGLDALRGLGKGRTEAREPAPVGPVDEATVEATLKHLRPIPAAMVQLQRLTGARPEEVCILRPCDVDRSGEVWRYTPSSHKTEHHGRQRTIFIGPKAQEVLSPFLLRASDAYCFDPREAERKRREEEHAARKVPLKQGNAPGTNRVRKPKRKAGARYTVGSYRQAIQRAADLAGVPRWRPNQLRHSAATEIRKEFGLEAAQVVLGHSKANVTETYAERDAKLAEAVVKRLG